ncbi:GNAT family N-acetyltransferase [Bifidobacterium aerophilum]|uniref:GNAT family N-acetyltransferase n=1 Tax=Bifidobacterium aerophilum TaxID=1798155 RepID=A0A6N9Z852_9BIFI|nr:GNAT family N-acetyltransferase [Bifidobacterium aerophilum]
MSVFQSLRAVFHPGDDTAIRMPDELPSPTDGPASVVVPISLRPLTQDDEAEWNDVRWRNREWLAPWDSGDPTHGAPLTFNTWIQRQRRAEENGTGALFAITHAGNIVGQISLGAVSYGAMRTGVVGYWVSQDHAGHGFAPMALAILADWALTDPSGPRLHRLEIAILPENHRSRRVVEKLGAHAEGVREKYMYINGQWRDHETYSLLAEDAREGFLARLLSSGSGR